MKGKREKKDGFCHLCIWNVRDLLRRRERKQVACAKQCESPDDLRLRNKDVTMTMNI